MRNAPAPARAEHLYPQRTNTQMRSATVAAAPPHPHAQRTYSKTDAFRLGRNLPHRPCRRLRNVDDRVRRGGCRRTSSQYRTNNPPFVPMQTPSHSTLANRAFGWGTCLHFRKTLRAPSGCPQGDFPTGKILPSGRISGPEGTSLSSAKSHIEIGTPFAASRFGKRRHLSQFLSFERKRSSACSCFDEAGRCLV